MIYNLPKFIYCFCLINVILKRLICLVYIHKDSGSFCGTYALFVIFRQSINMLTPFTSITKPVFKSNFCFVIVNNSLVDRLGLEQTFIKYHHNYQSLDDYAAINA